ncbi:MAG TPA: hypothetical protein VKX28_12985 [Xanthobacteraceae bacterium]|jgi:hypothetical protein|nr:hypothetical protein [Xanthobacteraceae bacterium]
MSTERRDQVNQFHQDRDSASNPSPATRAGAAAQLIVGSIDPAPAAPRTDSTEHGQSWPFIASLLIVVALAICATVAVAAFYGPVFTQPVAGP